MAKQKEISKIIALMLVLSMLVTLITFVPTANVYADEQTASEQATFENTSGDGGLDVINLCEERTFKAMIPISSASSIDKSNIVWSLDRNTAKPYVDAALYPNQTDGGELSEWTLSGGTGNLFSDVTTEIETVGGQDYLKVEFTASAYFQNSRTGEILDTAPHSSGGEYLDGVRYVRPYCKTGW